MPSGLLDIPALEFFLAERERTQGLFARLDQVEDEIRKSTNKACRPTPPKAEGKENCMFKRSRIIPSLRVLGQTSTSSPPGTGFRRIAELVFCLSLAVQVLACSADEAQESDASAPSDSIAERPLVLPTLEPTSPSTGEEEPSPDPSPPATDLAIDEASSLSSDTETEDVSRESGSSAEIQPEPEVSTNEALDEEIAPPPMEIEVETPGNPDDEGNGSLAASTQASSPAAGSEDGAALPGAHRLTSSHTWQKWNNCGPSTAVMALSSFGILRDQLAAASELKPDREDTNVSPDELAAYIQRQGLQTHIGFGAERNLARRLIAAGLPVIAEQWIDVDGRGQMGHYRVLSGYDDASQSFITQDSYYGPNKPYSYAEIEAMWRPFLGIYVVPYLPEQAGLLQNALGSDADPNAMWQRVVQAQEAWVAAESGNAWAHFALGEARSKTGQHGPALEAFDQANALGLPFRTYWYQFGYYESSFAAGRHESLIGHADATIQSMQGENLEESHYWRAKSLRALGRDEEARAGFNRALEFNPNFEPARAALSEMGG